MVQPGHDLGRGRAVRGPGPPRHPLVHLSGQIQLAYKLALRRPVIEGFDLFYLAEYPVVLVITERLLATLQGTGVEGVSGAEFPEIVFAP